MNLKQLMREAQQSPHLELLLLEANGHDVPEAAALPPEAKLSAKQWFHNHGLIGEETLNGGYELTYEGQQLADELYRSRLSGEQRWDLVTREILAAAPNAVTNVDGVDVSAQERQIALGRIEKWNLANVLRLGNGEIGRIIPNARASEALAVRGSLRDHFEPQSYSDHSVNNTTNISGGNTGGVITGGSANTMNVTQTITPLEAAGLNAKVDEILNALAGLDDVEDLVFAVEGIREELALPTATKEALKDKVLSAISVAGDLAGVAQLAVPVVPMLAQLASMLGG